MSESYTASSYYFSSASNSADGTTNATGHRYKTSSLTEPNGTTTTYTTRQELGHSPTFEEHQFNNRGQEYFALPGPGGTGTSAGGVRRIVDMDNDEAGGGAGATTETGGQSEFSAFEASTPRLEDGAAVPFGTKVVDVDTGAYDEHMHFYGDTTMRHHREVRDDAGRRFTRDVDFDPAGRAEMAHERRLFENPETGTRVEREGDVEVSQVI
ncbi:hypothetical protein N7539_007878 [Penicillium diatomitis]|uniref:Uncharacterized protein n=1 Tax=Penicillium diatomitis TaxID=2819901 RepID=A0A9W9WUI8_9EURO|nr:uncharacterized protein N7539_007878 [Penicillium diatomitis]KAJ5475591.1 hypothetical protein N7539_007878 [Penicillium diatomitis]